MSREYVNKEVDKVINTSTFKFPENFAMASAWIMGNFKGVNLKVLNVKEKSSLTDYFVMASTGNIIQSRAMAEEIVKQFKRHKHTPISQEGIQDADWILLDFNDIIIHIFLENSREFYDLDRLWEEATSVEIPQSYYFSSTDDQENSAKSSGSDDDYF